jgi:hypothetical protein
MGIAQAMKPTINHLNRPTRHQQNQNQLPLALLASQASNCIPNEVRMKCLPLWRELLQAVVLKVEVQNGGSHER